MRISVELNVWSVDQLNIIVCIIIDVDRTEEIFTAMYKVILGNCVVYTQELAGH